jgi:hypothetical protein
MFNTFVSNEIISESSLVNKLEFRFFDQFQALIFKFDWCEVDIGEKSTGSF